jgi:hypothetical protein
MGVRFIVNAFSMSFLESKTHSVATDGEMHTQNAHKNASVIDPQGHLLVFKNKLGVMPFLPSCECGIY